jgi:aminoglycoside phosphotransferase family enzyme/predicted kinase
MTGQKNLPEVSAPPGTGDLAALVSWLQSPEAYCPVPQGVLHLETHISHVFLAGDMVYKLKKPVQYNFLDFSTLPLREHACREEVRLNRRMAPHIYLGVVPITRAADGSFGLAGRGEVIDYLVQMQRLPADRMLDALYHRGALQRYDIDRLAERLAQFYAGLKPVSLAAETYRTRILTHVHGNLDNLLDAPPPLRRTLVRRVQGFQLQLLQFHPELFDQRVQAGRIVEGHGDLRAEHICFTDPIAIFDCIEFNEEFRQLDVIDELAFLAAECDFIGAAWVGPRLFQRFQELSGDHPPGILIDFYKAYRASVRAKVAALRSAQLTGAARDRAVAEAASHLDLADRYVAPHLRPLVLVVGGLSGTGKSTLARSLAREFGAELLSSDVVRLDLFGAADQQQGVDAGRYHPEARQRIYQEMFRRAAELHHRRVSVVLDATFGTAADVHAVQTLAHDRQALFLAIECRCDPEVARERITKRLQAGTDASEARPEVYDQQRSRWEQWPAEIPQLVVDTQQPLAAQSQAVVAELSRR